MSYSYKYNTNISVLQKKVLIKLSYNTNNNIKYVNKTVNRDVRFKTDKNVKCENRTKHVSLFSLQSCLMLQLLVIVRRNDTSTHPLKCTNIKLLLKENKVEFLTDVQPEFCINFKKMKKRHIVENFFTNMYRLFFFWLQQTFPH